MTGPDPSERPPPDRDATNDPAPREARQAALDSVERERLLEGEDEDTAYLDDAVHWSKVYLELLEFKRSLLTVAEHSLAVMHDDARSEVEETDLKVLNTEAARFERRLDFWQERIAALRAASGTEPA